MSNYKFKVGDKVIINDTFDGDRRDIRGLVGVVDSIGNTSAYPYDVVFDLEDGSKTYCPFDENELNLVESAETVTSNPFGDTGKFEAIAKEIGALVDNKQLAYGNSVDKAFRLMQIYLENYDNGDGTYTIPVELLQHMLLMVRVIDKQNRIFNNPKADLMGESPYSDLAGYSLLGLDMQSK